MHIAASRSRARWWAWFANGNWFAIAFFVLLATPATVHMVFPSWTWGQIGNRLPHSFPPLPKGMRELVKFPAGIDAWVGDRHGMRQELLTLNGAIRWHVFGDVRTSRLVVGRNERVFLGAHDGYTENSLILEICGATQSVTNLDQSVGAITGLMAHARADGFDPFFLIVPTAARLYPEDVPAPLDARCAGRIPPVDRLAARLSDAPDGARTYYPLDLMVSLKPVMEAIPRRNFHWAGETPLRVLEQMAEQRMGLRPAVDRRLTVGRHLTDLAVLNPGMFEFITVNDLDVAALGMRACDRAVCGLVHGLTETAMRPVYRYLRDGPGDRLLIIGDSFAEAFAPLLTLYAAEVWFINANALSSVPPDQRMVLMNVLRTHFAGRKMIMLYHDYGALTSVLNLTELLWPKAAPQPPAPSAR